VAEAADGVGALRVVVADVEPFGSADGSVAGDLQHDIRDLVTPGRRSQRWFSVLGRRRGPIAGHSSDRFDDCLTAFDVAFAVIEDSAVNVDA
jgi:hypothetical protein